NHALLTVEAIKAAKLPFVGWVANCIDPQMLAMEENIVALTQRINCPLLGVLPFDDATNSQQAADLLAISKLTIA
ncbi:MAG: AAA family ATPase, partial [Nitrosomonas sp.]|nr:AAA family ATPase [Nitrosomonas sp.]